MEESRADKFLRKIGAEIPVSSSPTGLAVEEVNPELGTRTSRFLQKINSQVSSSSSPSPSPVVSPPVSFYKKLALLPYNVWRDIKTLTYTPMALYQFGKYALQRYKPIPSVHPGTGEKVEEKRGPSPLQLLKEGFIQDIKEYKHPLHRAWEHPLLTSLDILSLASLGGAGASLAGKGITSLGKARLAKIVSETPEYLELARKMGYGTALEKVIPVSKLESFWESIKSPISTLAEKGKKTYFSPDQEELIPSSELTIGEKIKRTAYQIKTAKEIETERALAGERIREEILHRQKEWQRVLEGKELTPEEQGLIIQYAEIPANRIPETVKIIDNNPRLQRIISYMRKRADEQLDEIAKEFGKETAEYFREIRPYEPIAISDLKKQLGDRWYTLDEADKVKLIENRIKEIKESEITSNLFYFPHQPIHYLKAGGEWFSQYLPRFEFLRRDIKPGYLKRFKGEPQAPINITTNLQIRASQEAVHKVMKDFINDIVKKHTIGIYRGQDLIPEVAKFNPDLDLNWARIALNTEKYLISRPGISNLKVKQIQTGLENLKEKFIGVVDKLQTDEKLVKTSDIENLAENIRFLDELDPQLAKAITMELTPDFQNLFDLLWKKKHEEFIGRLTNYLKKHPTYIIARDLKQVLDKSSQFTTSSQLKRVLVDFPVSVWRAAVLGFPRWLVYNITGNIIQNILHGTSPLRIKELFRVVNGVYYPKASFGDILAFRKALAEGKSFPVEKLGEGIPLPESVRSGGFVKTSGFVEEYAPSRYSITGEQLGHTLEKAGFSRVAKFFLPKTKTFNQELEFTTIAPSSWRKVSEIAKRGLNTAFIIRDLNEKAERMFRSLLFIDEAHKAVIRDVLKNLNNKGGLLTALAKRKDLMIDLLKTDEGRQAVLNVVNDFMFDYRKLQPWEKFIRNWGIIPFWAWYRNMFKLVLYTLPFKYPIRTNLLYQLAELGKREWEETLKKYGISPDVLKARFPWIINSIPIKYDEKNKVLTFWNTQGPNIFQTVSEANLLGALGPHYRIILERALAQDLFKRSKFASPFVYTDFYNRSFLKLPDLINVKTGKILIGDIIPTKGLIPPLGEHILRQLPPVIAYRELKDILKFGKVLQRYDVGFPLEQMPEEWRNLILSGEWVPYFPPESRVKSLEERTPLPYQPEYTQKTLPYSSIMKLLGVSLGQIQPPQPYKSEKYIRAKYKKTILPEEEKQAGRAERFLEKIGVK